MVRRDAVALVDAFDLSDHFLNSALGRKDGMGLSACRLQWFSQISRKTWPAAGNVYEALYDYAQKEPLNQTEARPRDATGGEGGRLH